MRGPGEPGARRRGPPGERDPTPLALGPVGLALASALFPGGLLEVRPLVQHELIERLPLGVVMADRGGAVFDVNAHAEQALALSRAELIGRSLDAIVAVAPHRLPRGAPRGHAGLAPDGALRVPASARGG